MAERHSKHVCLQDTAEFALLFQQEMPIKRGQFTLQDRHLLERVLSQVKLTKLGNLVLNSKHGLTADFNVRFAEVCATYEF